MVKPLFEVDYNQILRVGPDENWLYTIDVRKKRTFYRVSDLVKGKVIAYNSVEMPQIHAKLYPSHYIASKDGKYGLISQEKGVVIDFEYDQLIFENDLEKKKTHNNVILAQKNGKWGAFWNPMMKDLFKIQ